MQQYHENFLDVRTLNKALPALDAFVSSSALMHTTKQERVLTAIYAFLDILAEDANAKTVNIANIDYAIAKIDHIISTQLDQIIHAPEFKQYASFWNGLDYLIKNIDFTANVELQLLDVKKTELSENFTDAAAIEYSGLYKHLYHDEYDMPGASPVSVVISDYSFSAANQDCQLLANIAKIAELTHCPFIANVTEAFFLKDSIEEVMNIKDLKNYFNKSEYITFNSLRELEAAKFIGLCLPKFLLNPPYGQYNATKHFCYRETIKQPNAELQWAPGSFAFAVKLAESFKHYGWLVNIRGLHSGGKVQNLPLYQYISPIGLANQIPVQALIPETKELALSELGIIPLCYYRDTNYACFFSANSLQKPKRYETQDATANSSVAVRLPYVFLTSRIGHYLKVLQRENIGSLKDAKTLEHELNSWLSGLVTKMNSPDPQLMALHPLKAAKVVVIESPDNPGFFSVSLYIQPHFQVEVMDISLKLVAKIPQGKQN